jgi:hypothetical protein
MLVHEGFHMDDKIALGIIKWSLSFLKGVRVVMLRIEEHNNQNLFREKYLNILSTIESDIEQKKYVKNSDQFKKYIKILKSTKFSWTEKDIEIIDLLYRKIETPWDAIFIIGGLVVGGAFGAFGVFGGYGGFFQ